MSLHLSSEPLVSVLITGADHLPAPSTGTLTNVEAAIGHGFHWERRMTLRLPGRFRMTSAGIVNDVPAETYITSVIASEMNPAAPIEFLKAHAIISRGWMLGKYLGRHPRTRAGALNTPTILIGWEDTAAHDYRRDGCHICNDDHCQRYQGFLANADASAATEAVSQTRGLVLEAADGSLVDARFSKCCGGHTEEFSTCWQDMAPPSLKAFPDKWCDLSSLSAEQRHHLLSTAFKDYDLTAAAASEWSERSDSREIERRLSERYGRSVGKLRDIKVIERGASGRASKILLEGTAGTLLFGKELFIRRLLSERCLLSSAFTVRKDGESFTFSGRGWGHGVGLCQTGAARMAIEGATATDILAFYYPGSRLMKIY